MHVLAGRLHQRLDALRSATVGTAFQLAVAVLVGGTFAVAAVHRDGDQVWALPGFQLVLDRTASAIGPVVFAVARESVRACKCPAARIALDRQVVSWIDVRLANRARQDDFFFFFFFLFSAALDGRAEWQSRAERSFRA